MQEIVCHKCGHRWAFEPPLGRRDLCPACGRDSRTCLNCQYFEASAYRQCREPQAEWVKEKETGNFCGYFRASTRDKAAADLSAKQKLEQLFGGEGSSQPSGSAASLGDELAKFLKSRK